MLDLTNGQVTVIEIFHDGKMRKKITWTDAPEVFDTLIQKQELIKHLERNGAELVAIKHIELLEIEKTTKAN